jgi:glycine/D-amino acid oxidase-like deaminating enzyme
VLRSGGFVVIIPLVLTKHVAPITRYEAQCTKHVARSTKHYLIVGQGLAGSLLAHALLARGQTVCVVEGALGSSSRVAAGVCNPVTGRKPTRTWLAEELFGYLHEFYPRLEAELGTRFFHPTTVYRPYRSIEEQNDFIARTARPELEALLTEAADHAAYAPLIQNPLGGLLTRRAAWVEVPRLLDAFGGMLRARGVFREARFDYADLTLDPAGAQWEGTRFDAVVCCEGVFGTQNPYFGYLPFQPVKGQTLTVRIEGPEPPGIVNQNGWLLPLGGGRYRVGATYEWDDLTEVPTARGRADLVATLDALLRVPYRIEDQRAGIRPAVRGRRPLLGRHPAYPALVIFNGLGSKGVSLGPYFANQLAAFLVDGKELDPAVNIDRFDSLSYRQNENLRTE